MNAATRQFFRRWGGYVVFVIVFAIGCSLLSWWQWSRRAEKDAEIALINHNYSASPVAVDSVLPHLESWVPSREWTRVDLQGHYLRDDQLLVRNRPYDGTPGFEVLVPFLQDNGDVVVVDRGWVPTGSGRSDYPDSIPAAPSGEVTVVARLRQSEPNLDGHTAQKGELATIHVPDVARIIHLPTYIGAYGALQSETPAPATRPLGAHHPSEDDGVNTSYAIQWIVFALLAFIGLGWAIRRDRMVARADAAEAVGTPLPPPPVRRRRTDAEEEDALLDARLR